MSRRHARPLSAAERAKRRHEADRERRERREAKRLADILDVTPATAQDGPQRTPAPTTHPRAAEGHSGPPGRLCARPGTQAPPATPGTEAPPVHPVHPGAGTPPAPDPTPRRRYAPRCVRCGTPVERADLVWVRDPPLLSAAVHVACRLPDDVAGFTLGHEADRPWVRGKAKAERERRGEAT